MKELVLISGKGGTGKTSVSASLAVLAGKSTLGDCDVDAADLHLLLKPKMKEEGEFKAGKMAVIDQNKCTACGECLQACRFEAIIRDGSQFRAMPLDCEGCGVCKIVCPAEAVTMEEKLSGWWYVSDTRCGPMVYARLKAGEENSGKLVSLVRTKARQIAGQNHSPFVIIDGPPGIGCPVIASIGGTNLALIVTEPTPAGVHDLIRICGLTAHFQIKTCVCINKFDLNKEVSADIEKLCREKNIAMLGQIPYDLDITRAMLAGQSVVEHSKGQASQSIKRIWQKLKKELD